MFVCMYNKLTRYIQATTTFFDHNQVYLILLLNICNCLHFATILQLIKIESEKKKEIYRVPLILRKLTDFFTTFFEKENYFLIS